MYALVEIKGKQYRVEEGSKLTVDRFDDQEGNVAIDKVLLLNDEGAIKIGTPYLNDVKVVLRLTGEQRGNKVRVFKYKRRKNYRRTQGHRQRYTGAVVESIVVGAA